MLHLLRDPRGGTSRAAGGPHSDAAATPAGASPRGTSPRREPLTPPAVFHRPSPGSARLTSTPATEVESPTCHWEAVDELAHRRARSVSARELAYRVTVNWGARVVRSLERLITWGSRVGNPTFFEPARFPWVEPLERSWPAIRRELDGVLAYWQALPAFQDISIDQRDLSDDDRWKTFFFYAYGIRADKNCSRCPVTTGVIEAVPGMMTAFFSIIEPGKHIPPHRGPFKGVLRYHLGLMVPEPRERCRIRVGSDIRHWEEGGSLLFDDTYEHEVWNDTGGRRVVLFLDVVRPLRFPANWINRFVLWAIAHSPFVQDGVRNYKAWEERLDKLVNAAS